LSLIGNLAEVVAKTLENYTGDREALAYHLNLVLTEAMANAIEHSPPSNNGPMMRVCIYIEGKDLHILVYDQGRGFDLESIPAPDFEALNERGRGIFLIRSLMDDVSYRKTECGNVLEMHKKLG
jgi:serine/threonine-protein kinase RsbW